MFEHEHPLELIDLWSKQLQHDKEYGEDELEEDEEDASLIAEHASLIAIQEFRCRCFRCENEINWFHRYYWTCCQCDYSIHKFCKELPDRLQVICHAHTLYLLQINTYWRCNICRNIRERDDIRCRCSECDFDVDANCATKRLHKNIIYHPSHTHPLFCLVKPILCECDACGKEHKGIFYHCIICPDPFIYDKCVFQPKKLQIQHSTNGFFSHIHPLTLAYSFPIADQKSKFYPTCRVCHLKFSQEHLWIYKCEKCRYYTHFHCTTSRGDSPPGRTTKNYEDAKHPDLVHLPFPDPSYSIIKHLFSKENISVKNTKTPTISRHHHHQLILEDAQCDDITSPTSSRIKSISFHDPMKNIQLLCDGCLRPIISKPIYVCANGDEDCNFVLHEWCSRLPTKFKDYHAHQKHPLILHSKVSSKFFEVFYCDFCKLPCNGFAYCCNDCNYNIDVNCAFLPKEITHSSHSNHLLSRVSDTTIWGNECRMCGYYTYSEKMFSCQICNFHLHTKCALLIPKTTTHKCDKHPMELRYFPAENHKGDYFCEVCEEEFDPQYSFYHCDKCMQSMHTACAPSVLRYETETYSYDNGGYDYGGRGVHRFVNVKFGGTFNNIKVHPHPLSFVQGIESDGKCDNCGNRLRYQMIFKCLNCKFAAHVYCCNHLIE